MHPSHCVSLLEKLITFPTVSNRPVTELAAFVASYLEDLGFQIRLDVDPKDSSKLNVIANAGPHKEGGLILSGHMDVVPTEGQPWTTDPFKLTEKEGKLFGRGTADMKGFIASVLSSLKEFPVKNLKEPLMLIFTHDEEVGCKGSHRLGQTLKQYPTFVPKEAIIGEPTDFQILRMHSGHVTLKITTQGQAAHSSKPDLGASAIKAMGLVLNLLSALENDLKKERRLEEELERPYVTLNTGMIHGGQAINIVPDHCELFVGYRPLPGDDSLALFRRLESRIQELVFETSIRCQTELMNVTPALLTPKSIPLENTLRPHASCSHVGAASFATDAGNLANAGIQSLIFGPGSIDVAHKANEFIEAADLVKSTQIITEICKKLL